MVKHAVANTSILCILKVCSLHQLCTQCFISNSDSTDNLSVRSVIYPHSSASVSLFRKIIALKVLVSTYLFVLKEDIKGERRR